MSKSRIPHYRVMFYVQHLLGIGHYVRSLRIARALETAGIEVLLVSGGLLLTGFEHGPVKVLQLPPVKAGVSGFSALAHPDGAEFTGIDKAERTQILLNAFDEFTPDVLLMEAFPFGRRQMRFELLPLLERAKSRVAPPLIAASVRDILQQNRKAGRNEETFELIQQYFDLIFVHGDPQLVTLEQTFPLAVQFTDKIIYTGMVGAESHPALIASQSSNEIDESFDVIVSAGGGAVGENLIRSAIATQERRRSDQEKWLILTGPNLPDAIAAEFTAKASQNLVVQRFNPNLAIMLGKARLSISQAGYNTVADILAAGCASVLVPFSQDGETEQSRRTAILESAGLAIGIGEASLTAQTLHDAIDGALALPKTPHRISLDGAARTAAMLKQKLSAMAENPQLISISRQST